MGSALHARVVSHSHKQRLVEYGEVVPTSKRNDTVILIAYDGSEDAQAAVDQAGDLFPGEPVTILTVWEAFIDVMTRSGAGLGIIPDSIDIVEIDEAYERSARETAQAGVARASKVGLPAEAHARARVTSIADAILSEADEVGARAIVVGSRGLNRLRSVFLGSVSNGVVHHADRPVVVVTSAGTAAARHRH